MCVLRNEAIFIARSQTRDHLYDCTRDRIWRREKRARIIFT